MDFDSYNGIRKAGAQQGRDVFGYAATGQARALVWDSAVQSPVIQEASLRGHARLDEFGRRIIDWTAEAYRLKHGADMPAKTAELLEPIQAELTNVVADMERAAKATNRLWYVDDDWPALESGAVEGSSGNTLGRLSEEALGEATANGEELLAEMVEHKCAFPPRDPLAKSGIEFCECGMGRAWYKNELTCAAPGYNVNRTF